MTGGAGSVLSHHAESVGVVDHERGVVFLAEFHQPGHGRQVSLHGVHAVHHNEFVGVPGGEPELLFQVGHVVMLEFAYFAETQAAAVYDAGMVKGVEEYKTAAESKAAHHSQVHLETGAVGYGLFLAGKFGQFSFELFVKVERTVEETAARTACALLLYGSDCGLLEARVIGQSKVGIGSEHEHLGAVSHCDQRVLPGRDGTVVRINSHGLYLVRQSVLGAGLV